MVSRPATLPAGGAVTSGEDRSGLHRHDAVLAPGALRALGPRHLESADQRRAGVAGIDDVVDEGSASGDVGVDQRAELLHAPSALGVWIIGGGDLLAIHDVRAAFGAHDTDFR